MELLISFLILAVVVALLGFVAVKAAQWLVATGVARGITRAQRQTDKRAR